jgi:formylglycine-generating enzyme required for sulfatase activity
MTDERDDESRLGQAIADFLELERSGAPPSPAEFAARHPEIAVELRARLELLAGLPASNKGEWEPPRELGDFRLVRPIGRGGMGVVWEAEQKSLGRRVALKILPRAGVFDAERLARFRREIEATAQLDHPHIIAIHACGEIDGLPFYAMPLLAGRPLDRALAEMREGARPATLSSREELVGWARRFAGVARALAHAHARGILHRDVKPSNLFLEDSGELSVLDFGLTHSLFDEGATATGETVGTPRYMSPEQILGGRIPLDGRSDLFSLAATFYEVLTLAKAFPGSDREAIFRAILAQDPRPPRAVDERVPRDLEVVLLKALEKEPARRYASVDEFADDLERFLDYRPVLARPVGWPGRLRRKAQRNPVAAFSIALALLAGSALALWPLLAAAAERRETDRRAEAEIMRARELGTELATLRTELPALEARLTSENVRVKPWEAPWAKSGLLDLRHKTEDARRRRDELFRDALAHLFSALRLRPGNATARRVIVELAFAEFRQAERVHDEPRMALLRPVIEAHLEDGAAAWPAGDGSIALASDPPDAEVFLFRCLERDLRRIPLPCAPPGRILAGGPEAGALRGPWISVQVLEAHEGPFCAGDEIHLVCGRPPQPLADVLRHLEQPDTGFPSGEHAVDLRRGGEFVALRLPPRNRIDVRCESACRAANPLACSVENRLGRTPLEPLALEMGSYLAVLRLDGRPDVRVPFEIAREEQQRLEIPIPGAERIGAGFVYVPPGPAWLGGDTRAIDPFTLEERSLPGFFMQERELTFAQYSEFVQDLERTNPEEARERAPREGRPGAFSPLWDLDAQGHVRLRFPPGLDESYPVVGVSYRDAEAYCRWRTAQENDPHVVYDLPTEEEWEKAARGADGRAFTWGDEFEWTFARLGFSGAISGLLPGGLYPTDESVYGLLDLNGNVREWCRGSEKEAWRVLRGGAWGLRVEADCRLASRANKRAPEFVDSGSGFRLVKRPVD